ncbi:MAG TPA: alpha/beta hydrolase-fold protein [Gaiellaceae bacterium]|nr:alpha/beta hydrolase-fold protein [Gaiellaceae bacterium]
MEIEPLADGRYRVTIAYRDDDAEELFVIGGLAGADPADRRLRRDADGWWRRSYELEGGARLSYWFTRELIPGELFTDPLNPNRHVYAPDPDVPGDKELAVSIVELPGAPERHWTVQRDVPRGTVESERVRSGLLENERRVFTNRPPGYDHATTYPLILCFDGQAYIDDSYVRLPTVLDNLIAERAIPPVVAVLPTSLDNETRHRELMQDEPFLEFLVRELIPWAHERLSFADDPARTVVAGASLGGLQAAFCGLKRSDVFGLVLSQSGSFQRGLPEAFAAAERLPLRFALDVGRFETSPLERYSSLYHANLHMRDVLVAKGYDVTFREYPTGHDFFWWGETIADGLISLLN